MCKKESLLQYQENFKDYIVGANDHFFETMAEVIEIPTSCNNSKGFSGQRLSIYKNNIYHSLSGALENLYPVICRVVGKDFFNQVAKAYLIKNFPSSPVLSLYGECFSEFISKIDSCSHLPYLKDLAQLEWCCHAALNSIDEPILDLNILSSLSEADLEKLCLKLSASVSFMESDFPIDDIWLENQKSEVGLLSIDKNVKRRLLIYRKKYKVELVELTPIVFYLLFYISKSEPIAKAWSLTKRKVEEEVDDDEFSKIFVYILNLSVLIN